MIEVEHITKRYGRVTAVDDVSFRVERGEILGFLGPNGAGKTTTMRILTGYMPPTDGRAPKGQGDVTLATIYCRMTDLRTRTFHQRDAMADARVILSDYPDVRSAVQEVKLFSSSAFKPPPPRLA